MKQILGLVIIAVIVIVISANVHGTIAEPATSTTAVAATSALGTAVVIQQLTMCVIPLGVLVVIALGIVAFIVWRNEHAQQNNDAPVTTAPARQLQTQNNEQINSPVRTVRRVARVRHQRTASRAAARWFK